MAESLLQIVGLGKSFGGLNVTNNVSFQLNQHEIVGLIGPNGAGKTTLLRLIMGILKPSSGSIRFKGKNISGLKTWDIVNLGIACTFQKHATFSPVAYHCQCYGFLHVPTSHEERRMGETH